MAKKKTTKKPAKKPAPVQLEMFENKPKNLFVQEGHMMYSYTQDANQLKYEFDNFFEPLKIVQLRHKAIPVRTY